MGKIIYRLPVIKNFVEKWNEINKKIKKLQTEKNELNRKIDELTVELRKSQVFREIDRNHARKSMRDMAFWVEANKDSSIACKYKEENHILHTVCPKVSMIIVNHNGKDRLETLMSSMVETDFYDNFEIIVVDNASTDDSLAVLAKCKKQLPIKIVRNNQNLSFSAANNIGAKEASGEYLLFLNNDTEVTDGWLDELLITAIIKEKVGAVGAKLVYPEIPSGSINAGKSYTIQHGGIAFRNGCRNGVNYWQPYNLENRNNIDRYTERESVERACVTAAVMLVKKEYFFMCGGYDERYLYGYEDVDLCLKLYEMGLHNYYCPKCLVFHYEFGTQSIDDPEAVRERRVRNTYLFREKWQGFLEKKIGEDKNNNLHIFTE